MSRLPVLFLLLGCLISRESHAENPPLSDLHGREVAIDDLSPRRHLPLGLEPRDATLSVAAATRQREEGYDYTGSLYLTLASDFLAAPPRRRSLSSPRKAKTRQPRNAPPALRLGRAYEAGHQRGSRGASLGNSPGDRVGGSRVGKSRVGKALPRLNSADLKAAQRSSLRVSGHPRVVAALDDLASRARWSALLPQLRLRATRLVDESMSLSPTSYDPSRTTSRGGASLWLEARTTWNLHRLVFADEEVRLQRLQAQARQEARDQARRLTTLLFGWQRAVYLMHDPALSPPQCIEAWLRASERAAELDIVTDGWLSRWLRKHPLPEPACDIAGPGATQEPP